MGEVAFFGSGSKLLRSGAGLGYFLGLRVCETGVGEQFICRCGYLKESKACFTLSINLTD
jgi:hypothetical protein